MPRAVLVSAAVFTLVFVAMNPDAWVADRNIDRFEQGEQLDTAYLSELSADATPVILERLPGTLGYCVATAARPPAEGDDWLAWNLGRARADDAVTAVAAPTDASECSTFITNSYRP